MGSVCGVIVRWEAGCECVYGGEWGVSVCVWQRVVLVGRGITLAPFAKEGGVMGCGVV